MADNHEDGSSGNDSKMTRRSTLRTLGAVGVASVAGGAFFATRGAQAQSGFTIEDASAVTTDDGNIKYVQVDAEHEVEWDGFDVPVAAVAWHDYIEVAPNSDQSTEHVLYDGRPSEGGPNNGLVGVDEFSSQGDGSDGWGGPDEWSEELSGDSQFEWMHGRVHAGIIWNIIVDPQYAGANSVEDPAEILSGDSILEPEDDGTTEERLIRYHKDLYFYRDVQGDETGVMTQGGREVVPMGQQDGTQELSEATAEFTTTVNNQVSQNSPSGDGSSSTGA